MNKLKQAQDLLKQGKLARAQALYQEILDEDPEHLEALHALAILHTQQEDYDIALKHIDKAIDIEPATAALYNSKGNILLRAQKYQEAINAFQKAIAIQPEYSIAYNNLGICYYHLGKLDDAKQAYAKAITYDQKYVDAHFNMGLCLAKLGKNQQAIKEFKQVVLLKPQYAAAYGQIAEVYLQQNDYAKAIEYFQKHIAQQPDHGDSYHNLGLALLKEKRYEEAAEAFENALIHQTEHKDVNHNLATAFLKLGNPEKALNYYYRQLEIEPQVETYYNIGVLLLQQQRHTDAMHYLIEVTKLDPEYLPAHLNLGALYLKGNKVADAIKHYQAALKIKPDDAEIHHILSALTKEGSAKAAPTEYLQHLFDQYATYYDKHLVEHLQYQVPEKIYQAIVEETNSENPNWVILDLGCGTGLCGSLFKKLSSKLIGVDISVNMIEAAREKNIYDVLKVEDIHEAVKHYQNVDLILAADVFTYIGELDDIFANCKEALNKKGLFAFSVEKTFVEPYELQASIRYAHSKTYLESLIKKYNFKTLRFDNLILRKQQKKPVEGYLAILEKT